MKIRSSKGEILTVPDGMEEAAMNAKANGTLKEFAEQIKDRMKSGGMIKRKDGSYSRRGLWDNIRANRGSGKKPTKEMLKQEAKIRAEHGAGGTVFKGYVTDWTPGEAVPWHESTIGEKMGKGGYTVKRSSARKGKTHVVIGPDGTKKYFGDSKLGQHPSDPKRKKAFYARHAKNLKGNPYFRAFARATWADGGELRLSDNMYENIGVMPYADGGYTFLPKMNYDGTIHVPYGYGTSSYNERYDLGGDIGAGLTGVVGGALGTIPGVGGFLKQGVNKLDEAIQGPLSNQEKSIRGYGSAAGAIGAGVLTGNVTGAISGGASGLAEGISAGSPNSKAAQNIATGLNVAGTIGGIAAGNGDFGNIGSDAATKFASTGLGQFTNNLGSKASMATPLMSMMGGMGYGGYVRMDDGGETGMVPINIEGGNFSSGSGPDAKKGELLVKDGKIIKNYVARPPHPVEGQNPMGDDEAPEGLIVIPKARTAEYLESGSQKRKQIERSLVSQQQDREMKKMKRPSKKMGDGGYYSFGMGDMGMKLGGIAYSDQLGGHDFVGQGGPIGNPETIRSMMGYGYKKGGWIQKATASIKRRGTEGVCTGSKFGGPGCPPGSRRYNLAKTFKKMARARHEDGGFVDPVTGSYDIKYANGGQLPEGLLRTRMRASGASEQEINDYVAARYEMGGATNVDRSAIYAGLRERAEYGGRLRYDEYSTVGGPSLSSGPMSASAPSTFIGAPTYSAGVYPVNEDNTARSNTYSATVPGSNKMSTPNYNAPNYNWSSIGTDVASMAPVLYNLGRGIFEKPVHMNAADYMSPGMQFRATRFDETPYQTARSRGIYGLRQAGAGPGYRAALAATTAGLGQAESQARLGWQNTEAQRRQAIDQANAEINARNKGLLLQTDIMNQQAKAARNEFFGTSAEQLAQEFGRNPRYFEALAGDKNAYRPAFSGWRATKG